MPQTVLTQKSYLARPTEVTRKWYVVDATGKVPGRLASQIAVILMGKHKPTYTPHVDTGDYVIVVNAEKVRLTGKKLDQEFHDWYTHYPGGRKVTSIRRLLEKHPEWVIELAVRRMLPKNKLGRQMFRKLKVYAGPTHPHAAQKPEPLELKA